MRSPIFINSDEILFSIYFFIIIILDFKSLCNFFKCNLYIYFYSYFKIKIIVIKNHLDSRFRKSYKITPIVYLKM